MAAILAQLPAHPQCAEELLPKLALQAALDWAASHPVAETLLAGDLRMAAAARAVSVAWAISAMGQSGMATDEYGPPFDVDTMLRLGRSLSDGLQVMQQRRAGCKVDISTGEVCERVYCHEIKNGRFSYVSDVEISAVLACRLHWGVQKPQRRVLPVSGMPPSGGRTRRAIPSLHTVLRHRKGALPGPGLRRGHLHPLSHRFFQVLSALFDRCV